MIIIIQKNYCN